jgi:hypothetical protein
MHFLQKAIEDLLRVYYTREKILTKTKNETNI